MRHLFLFLALLTGYNANAQKAAVYGRVFPEHEYDLSFENDCIGFRLYGPESQEHNEHLYGYDIFAKRVSYPVLNKWYYNQFAKEYWDRIKLLKKQGKKNEARVLEDSITYHKDHGEGADFYAVGPTLGAGVTAIVENGGEIVYPYCYKSADIIESGPYTFKVHLIFTPLKVGNDTNVIEHRILELRKGSQLCKCTVWYEGLTHDVTIATGIVLHSPSTEVYIDKNKRFMSYNEPTQDPKADNGIVRMGAKFSYAADSIKTEMFSKPKGQATGHLLAFSSLKKEARYTYWFGFGWSKYGFADEHKWIKYLKRY